MEPIIVYGVPFSQPVRAVLWVLLLKQHDFKLVMTIPGHAGENGSRHPSYLAKYPMGTIPCIEEPDTGFTLGEAHAILTYLSRSNGWTDVYPDDERARAQIDAYLHYHHRNVREASFLVATKVRKDLQLPEAVQEQSRQSLTNVLTTLNGVNLAQGDYLMGDALTLADIAACVELGQLAAEYTNLFDLTPFPRVCAWLDRMKAVPGYDQVHVPLQELGDISVEAPSIEGLKRANIEGLKALKNR